MFCTQKLIFHGFLLISISESFFHNPLKKIKQKAKQIYQKKFGKDKNWHFLGHDLSEYPLTNSAYKKINHEKWQEYYTCLKDQNENLGSHNSAIPEATQGFEGGSIKFECKICLSPSERSKKDSVIWYWGSENATKLEPIEYSEHILLSPEEKTLHIYNLNSEHNGQYICHLGKALTVPYFLNVVNGSENGIIEVHTRNSPKGPYPKEPETAFNENLILDTEWSEWSLCSKCNMIGRRHKVGYCTVAFNPQKATHSTSNNSDSDKEIENANQILIIFKLGIPCQSHILPKEIKNIPEVKIRKDEIMVGFCKEDCPEDEVFLVKDKNGNIIETANNSAGVYSMLQGPPPIEPAVQRSLQYGIKGQEVILVCPGNLNSDAPVQWQIGSQNIIPEQIAKESNGRVYISISEKLHVKKAKRADSNIYSCWQHNELAGTIRLVVEKKIVLNFNHHIMLFGIIIILSTFLYVYTRAFIGRKYAKIRN